LASPTICFEGRRLLADRDERAALYATHLSHGTADQILPIDQCSRIIVPRLRPRYDVTYREFEVRHRMPADILSEALRCMTA
jgi:predicted esterase